MYRELLSICQETGEERRLVRVVYAVVYAIPFREADNKGQMAQTVQNNVEKY